MWNIISLSLTVFRRSLFIHASAARFTVHTHKKLMITKQGEQAFHLLQHNGLDENCVSGTCSCFSLHFSAFRNPQRGVTQKKVDHGEKKGCVLVLGKREKAHQTQNLGGITKRQSVPFLLLFSSHSNAQTRAPPFQRSDSDWRRLDLASFAPPRLKRSALVRTLGLK